MSKVARIVSSTTAIKTFRERFTHSIFVTAPNQMKYDSFNLCSASSIQRALAALQYYDPSDPVNVVVANGNTGTFQRDFLFKSNFRAVVRNNFTTAASLRMYFVLPKVQTSQTPVLTIAEGFTDRGITSTTTVMMYPTDSEVFNHAYKIVRSHSCLLQAGSEIVWKFIDTFRYNPAVDDIFNKDLYPEYCGLVLVVFLEGCVGHEDVIHGNVGTMSACMDILTEATHKISYDAGFNAEFIEVINNSDPLTVINAVACNKPVVANQVATGI